MDYSTYAKQFTEFRNRYNDSKENTKKITEECELKVKEAKLAERQAREAMEDFVKSTFKQRLDELIGDAPVVMDVMIPLKEKKLPPDDEPDKYGVLFLPAMFKDDLFVDDEYASIGTIEKDFVSVDNGSQPQILDYASYYPSLSNIPFMPPNDRWHPSRYIPVRTFDVIKDIMDRNHKLYMERLEKHTDKIKQMLDKYTIYKGEGEDYHYIHLIGKDDVKLISIYECSLDTWPSLSDGHKSDPFWVPGLLDSMNRRKISASGACKILDKIVSNNRKYYKETMAEAEKWFNECVKLKKKRK